MKTVFTYTLGNPRIVEGELLVSMHGLTSVVVREDGQDMVVIKPVNEVFDTHEECLSHFRNVVQKSGELIESLIESQQVSPDLEVVYA